MTVLISIQGVAGAMHQVAGTGRRKRSSPPRPLFRSGLGAAALASGLVLACAHQSLARDEWPDGPYKAWFQNLQRPDNHLNPHRDEKSRYCCGIADTVDTKFKVESTGGPHPDDAWYAWLNEAWVRIPPEKIVRGFRPHRAGLSVLPGQLHSVLRAAEGGL